jgi:glycosyltransferase involved in cell wall biosynthesis
VTPRVTVLLAVYNGGAYLGEAVASVIAQTYDDFEVLIVDDASLDGAVEGLPHDPRIRVLRNERNLGQIPSLNRGLREASGELVARLDHDDVCLPHRLERQVELLDRLPEVALAATWVDIVETNGDLWTRVRPRVESFADFATQIISGHVHLVHPSLMVRRDVVLELGGFDETLNAAEDQDLYRRLVLARREARVVPETLLRYRRHEQQMTIAKSAAVWESDARSYNSFLAQLAPGSQANTIRLMLRNDARFWEAPPLAAGELESFLDAATTTLDLDDAEGAALARTLARSAATTLVSGWTGDCESRAFRSRSLALSRYTKQHGIGSTRTLARAAALLTATAPAGTYVGSARTLVANVLRSDALAGPRERASNSRLLRSLYARVLDTRSFD